MRKKFTNLKKSRSWLVALFSTLLLLTVNNAQAKNPFYDAADKKITGKVTDEKGAPLAGVSVLLKGSKKGVSTDLTGAFTISVPENDAVLEVSIPRWCG